ncbi:hypothetical protein QZH41_013937, partial [Actinostola sp. cb2023]
ETAQCECTAGFTGSDCSTVVHPGKGSWETLFMNRFSNNSYSDVARMAHTMVVHSHFVWMYGGYSMALGILDNVIRYDAITKTMSHVTTNQLVMNVPKARYFHCAVLHQDTMVVHGGVTQDGVSNEMWYFNVKSPSWTQIVISGPKEPKVAGHTCTLVGDIITVIGGYEPHAGLNNKVYQYSIPGKTWSVLEPLGTPPTGTLEYLLTICLAGLYGHTTIYHASTQSLFVFGGYRFKIHEVQPSGDVYTLHIPSRKWNLLQALPANQEVMVGGRSVSGVKLLPPMLLPFLPPNGEVTGVAGLELYEVRLTGACRLVLSKTNVHPASKLITVDGPIYGTCQGKTIDTGPQTPANMTKKISTQKAPVWASVLCPAENECLNGRHNCMALEDCEDTPESFKCVCKTGYERQGTITTTVIIIIITSISIIVYPFIMFMSFVIRDKCVPVCDGGCGNGTCVTPNNCSCTFGWTSRNCSMKCYCNNHGHCLNETTLDICYDCSNHTMGTSCQLCSPLYVGNATNNGTCRSCYDVCNKSAHVCMSIEDIKRASDHNLSLEPNAVRKWLDHGPVDIRQDRECLCRNNSRGIRCKHCIKEHFFLDSYCKPCQCNGHGDTCNDSNGRCPCHNNTKSDCRSSEPCYNLQCVKCKDNYLGRPSDSRQCYSKVTHLNEFAISSKPGLDLNGENNVPPLPKGSTRSYVVYPRYTNVDIRTIIDVFQGGLDVYVSTFDRTFAVHVNNTTWIHRVQITHGPRVRRNVEASDGSDNPNVINVYAGKDRLNTFVGLHSQTDIIKVRAVQRRLVLTFPFSKHQLRTSRFYMIFLGVGDGRYSDTTGIVYFRQDLSQIDLFVFFSVFFSVFFLVLAFCIVAWKMKQFHDRRRIAHVQEQELETMASRPFATYSFLTDMKSAPHSCWKIRREHSRRNLRDRKNHNLYMKEVSHRPVISPVAHQVSGDSRVAVVSVMFQLPSNENSDFQLAFGSVITTNSHQHSLGRYSGIRY